MREPRHTPSYYAATANPSPDHPQLEGDADADVCVVGAGFTGLSTALHLAESGYRVIVLEAQRVGWGASGRNGGQLIVGYAPGMVRTGRLVGAEDARRLWRLGVEAAEVVRMRVARHDIRCDLKPGYMLAAAKPGHMEQLARAATLLGESFDYDKLRLVAAAELGEMLGTKRYAGGLMNYAGGHLHPLNYALGLARAATAAGARIFEASPVERLDGGPSRAVLRTAAGSVSADHVVLAGNAYLGRLAPSIRSRVMPVGTYMIATEPLGERRARELVRDDICVSDTRFVLDYFRLSADHRMLYGGRVSYTTLAPPDIGRAMRRTMLRTFPQLADARVDFAWGGNVAITANRLPHFGRLEGNVFFAQGFSGQGVALTSLAGKLIAEAIAGTAERFDVFARIRHRGFPGGPALGPALLAAAMLYYRLRDLM